MLSTRVFAHWLQLDPIDAVLGWFASALLASGVWYSLEPWVQRLWGERPPTERQWLRLEAVVGRTSVSGDTAIGTFLIEEDMRVGVRTGLRTIVVTRGALDQLNDRQLGKLLEHGLRHLIGKSASPYGRCDKACTAL